MEKQKNYMIAKSINSESYTILQALRSLTNEEQRIAYAILEGMQLQKTLDGQRNTDISDLEFEMQFSEKRKVKT